MHHRSPVHAKHPSSYQQSVQSKSLEPSDNLDIKVEKQYLSKLRSQRERIQKLYLSYEQSSTTISTLTEQNQTLKRKVSSLEERLTIQSEHKQILIQCQVLEDNNSQLQHQNQQLRLKYEQKFVENNRKLKQLKQYYNQELQQLSLENGIMKDLNKSLELKMEQLKIEVSTQKIQLEEADKIIQSLRKQYMEIVQKTKEETSSLQSFLSERDAQLKKVRLQVSSLRDQNIQQSYFLDLEKQKAQELITQYTTEIKRLKLQVQQLETELLHQLQQNNTNIQSQQKHVQSSKQAKYKLLGLQEEFQKFRKSETLIKQKMQFLHNQQIKKLQQRVQLLEEELKMTNKDFSLLVGKYQRLQQMTKRKEMSENAKRQLISYEHQQIDKMDFLLKR